MINEYALKYGNSTLAIAIKDKTQFDVIQPNDVQDVSDPSEEVKRTLNTTLGNSFTKIHPGNTVAIAINDKTRPVPHQHLLPPLLEHLERNGIYRSDITFFIATGTHAPMQASEFSLVLPGTLSQHYRVVSHNCDNKESMVSLGKTSYGTPVFINRDYYRSDIRIVVGNIEPHHFMGFSGGVKTAAIGLTARETINTNHSHLVNPEAKTGNYKTNPCRMDVEEIGSKIGISYALNAILNTKSEIVRVFWGDPVDVMINGVELSTKICQVEVPHRYDAVVVSAGGYPKDINLYQAQKALTNAAEITRDGGDVYLIADCPEGAGNPLFVKFMDEVHTPKESYTKFINEGFSVGPHKAFLISKIAARVNIHLLSNLDPDLVKRLLFNPITKAELERKLRSLPEEFTMAIMPQGVVTIPHIPGE